MTQKRSSKKARVKLKQIKVRISEETDAMIRELAKEYNFSIAFVIRALLEDRVNDYFGTINYSDKEQSDRIEELHREILKELRLFHNNIKRIGNNYNQEIRLKNEINKYTIIIEDKSSTAFKREEAKIKRDLAVRELEDTRPQTDELKNLLVQFTDLVERTEDTLCHIQE